MSNQKQYTNSALVEGSEEVLSGRGKNIIPPPEKDSLWKRYFEKFNDPLILILFVALLLSMGMVIFEISQGGTLKLIAEPIGILIAILLSTWIGFYVELQAEKEFEVLNTVNDEEEIKVFRKVQTENGLKVRLFKVKKLDVCVGDYVRIEAGDSIPADGILCESNQLLVDESMFTGEPFARKSHNALNKNQEDTYAENQLLRGATVIEGNGIYKVTSVGLDTEEGKGAVLTQKGKEVKTPLRTQLDGLGKFISYVSMGLGVVVLLGRIWYFFSIDSEDIHQGMNIETVEYILNSIMIAVTLVVAAVPEGLPMSITMSLALSMKRMLKENNLVRRLHACETMGAATVICSDKTGTLTQNKMTVMEYLIPDNVLQLVKLNVAINSTATLNIGPNNQIQSIGNPTEGALLRWLEVLEPETDLAFRYQTIRESYEIVQQMPFSTEKKYMATEVVPVLGGIEAVSQNLLKGAPEVIMSLCDSYADGLNRGLVSSVLAEYQAKAMRTLAFAADGVFLGIVGIADPIREDVAEAIDICKNKAHVKVIIVTGDTPGTANEIGRQIGLLKTDEQDMTITGPEFAALDDATIMTRFKENSIKIIARARPDDKARLVRLLQRNHDVVAVTGDGTNDAPALSKAHVGLSMGDGTARAKEASDITIIDNSFASINKAILWGRSIYKNIRRFIVFQTIVNVSACLIVLIGSFVGMDSPLNVMQMLWVNLIMDTFAALALSTLPPDPNVMNEYPRSRRAHIINKKTFANICTYGIFFVSGLTALWIYMYKFANEGTSLHLSPQERGIFFTAFVFIQFWNLFNTRYFDTDRSLFGDIVDALKSRILWNEICSVWFVFIAVVILVGQVLIVECCEGVFEIDNLTTKQWLMTFAATSLAFFVPEILRCFKRLKNK